jgi:hypothetical protein
VNMGALTLTPPTPGHYYESLESFPSNEKRAGFHAASEIIPATC